MKVSFLSFILFLLCGDHLYSQNTGFITANPSTVYQGAEINFVLAGNDPLNELIWEKYDKKLSSWVYFEGGGTGFTDFMQRTDEWESCEVRCFMNIEGYAGDYYATSIPVIIFPKFNPGAITGETMICSGTLPGTYSFSTLPSGGNATPTYQWQISTDNVNWVNASSTQSTYTPATINPIKTYIRCSVSAGAGAVSTNILTVNVDNSFSQTIKDNQTICYGAKPNSIVQNTFEGGKVPFSYQWQYSTKSDGWKNIESSGASSTFTPKELTDTTYYRRIVKDACNKEDTSNKISVFVRDSIMLSISKKEGYCKGENIIVSVVDSLAHNKWYKPNWDLITDNDSLIVGKIDATMIYYLQSTDENGCSSDTIKVPIILDPIKADFRVNILEIKQGELQKFFNESINGQSYVWILKEGVESNIPSASYRYDSAGWYDITLIASSKNGCNDTCTKTNVFRVLPSNLLHEETIDNIKIYPQPARDILNIDLFNGMESNLSLYTISGEKVKECTLRKEKSSIDISELKNGAYILKINSDDGTLVSRIIIKE